MDIFQFANSSLKLWPRTTLSFPQAVYFFFFQVLKNPLFQFCIISLIQPNTSKLFHQTFHIIGLHGLYNLLSPSYYWWIRIRLYVYKIFKIENKYRIWYLFMLNSTFQILSYYIPLKFFHIVFGHSLHLLVLLGLCFSPLWYILFHDFVHVLWKFIWQSTNTKPHNQSLQPSLQFGINLSFTTLWV